MSFLVDDAIVHNLHCREPLNLQHIAVLYFLVIWVWKSMQRPNEQQQRLSSWAINYLNSVSSHRAREATLSENLCPNMF